MTLTELGWNEFFAAAFARHAAAKVEPARVVCELRRNFYAVRTADDEVLAECGGGFFHHARTPEKFPAVGDWVAIRRRAGEARADIQAVLPRRTKLSRRAAGSEQIEQIIAANIDTALLVSGLDLNFSPRRIQRFLVAAKESGAEAAIILNKSDVCADADAVGREVETLAPGVRVHLTSVRTRHGIRALAAAYARPGRTLAFVGSSGVGKSSLINALDRDADLPIGDVREKDSKGRHTTTRRELVITRSGALIIDTPGMREFQLWDSDAGLEDAFADVVAIAARCRFSDCNHTNEPDCAVRVALASGELTSHRYDGYQKLKSELNLRRAGERKKPSALASKPGWKKKAEGQKSFRWSDRDVRE